MSDLRRRLPRLRLRRGAASSAPPRDWRPRIASAVRALAEQLAVLPEEGWSAQTLSPRPGGGRVEDVVADLARRLSSPRLRLVLPARADAPARDELLLRLRSAADRAGSGRGRHGLGELTAVVQACYDITVPLGLPDPVAPDASQAVARGRVALGSAELRALLRGRSLVADDAGWRIGSGPEIRGPAGVLVSWLCGRPVVPVFPPRGTGQA
ncbi:hypothetical protein [Naasia sp. SYSU D00948]|uniref:hypothetical protein n=1 Tax=Naasia sp. SYSU D00948 TaxID=2817379 RepID=UPI001B30E87C|nr:hypothetical protein [Naasia sp. SYSU D00948]